MNKGMTRREWINRSAKLFSGSVLGAVAGIHSINATTINSLSNEPVRMMFTFPNSAKGDEESFR